MKIKKAIYDKILNFCPSVPPETGGILGRQNGVICFAEPDLGTPQNDRAVYIPNTEKLNSIIEECSKYGIEFAGIYHSHPIGQETLSNDDIAYINSVFENMPESITELYFPIVIPKSHITAYKAIKKKHEICIKEDSIYFCQEDINE